MKHFIFFVLFSLSIALNGVAHEELFLDQSSSFDISTTDHDLFYLQTGYSRPSNVSEEVWEQLQPYFLPEDHPAKKALDQIFLHSKSRVILDKDSLVAAGFHFTPKQGMRAVVITHPSIPRFVMKTYLDAVYHPKDDWISWTKRIEGSKRIRKYLKNSVAKFHFKVAQKWIYPLPQQPSAPKGMRQNHFILVVENMDLLPHAKNKEKWNQLSSKKILEELYQILRTVGLRDCARPSNIPWCKDGYIAFVDTEDYGKDFVPYVQLNKYLNSEMQQYWIRLTQQKSKKSLVN